MTNLISRRKFLFQMGMTSIAFAGFASSMGCSSSRKDVSNALVPDPKGILDLPKGFTYSMISETGQDMEGGFKVPERPDGMAAFSLPNGDIALIRNHEILAAMTPFIPNSAKLKDIPKEQAYDGFVDSDLRLAGGTSTIVLDAKSLEKKREFYSLLGTKWNCAGGATPWNTWISCEETESRAYDKIDLARYVDWGLLSEKQAKQFDLRIEKDHGYAFEVDPLTDGLSPPEPLRNLGRFQREAIAVDPRSNIIYQTEDHRQGLFYRFIPQNSRFTGKLQALKIKERKKFNTQNSSAAIREGYKYEVEWVDIEDYEAQTHKLREYGFNELGATQFIRGEGISVATDGVYFVCTEGGYNRLGQIWKYSPSKLEGKDNEKSSPGYIELFYESKSKEEFFMGDNLTVSPWGDLIVCEDNYSQFSSNRILGIKPDGTVYKVANNPGSSSEFAGACFSPDNRTMFVNLQIDPGRTFAIKGDWNVFK